MLSSTRKRAKLAVLFAGIGLVSGVSADWKENQARMIKEQAEETVKVRAKQEEHHRALLERRATIATSIRQANEVVNRKEQELAQKVADDVFRRTVGVHRENG